MKFDKSISKQVITLAIPIIFSNLSRVIMGLTDMAMVSRLGAVALAATGMGEPSVFCLKPADSLISRWTDGRRRPLSGNRTQLVPHSLHDRENPDVGYRPSALRLGPLHRGRCVVS